MKNLIYCLLFALTLTSCSLNDYCDDDNRPAYIPTSGVINYSTSNQLLKGTTWVIYKYRREGDLNYHSVSDTVWFISNREYNYADRIQVHSYYLIDNDMYYGLTMNFTRFGSQITCSNIPKFALEDGDIQVAKFKDNTIGTTGDYYYIFMKKI